MSKARKPLYPLPVDALFHHPEWIALPSAGAGMLIRLCEHFWRTRCKPLPKDSDGLRAIARAHRPTWMHHEAAIREILADIEPELLAYYARRENGRQGIAQLMENARAARARKRAAANLADAAPHPQSALLHAMPIVEPGRRASDVAAARAPDKAPEPATRPRMRA